MSDQPKMSEPDFEQIANGLIMRASTNSAVPPGTWHVTANAIAEQLRLVWNARGAADRDAIETALLDDGDNSQQNNIERAIRSLDR